VTTTCFKWLRVLDSAAACAIITESINFLLEKYRCCMLGYVIMPNHVHFILYFPEQNRLSDFMRDFKKYTSVKLKQLVEETKPQMLSKFEYSLGKQRYKIWMDRFDDVFIHTLELLHRKLNYIHNNPLQEHWKLTAVAEDYLYSSAGFYNGRDTGKIKVTNYIEYIS
jgi:putative transposase